MNENEKTQSLDNVQVDEKKSGGANEKSFVKISAFEPGTLILGIIMALMSAVICMQIIGKVGVTPNTSLIGAIFAMILGRFPIKALAKFRDLERQNYIQTIISGAGFAAANGAFLGVAIFFVMNRVDMILPMAIGCMLGTGISVIVVGKLFDSRLFPGDGAWPAGVATTEALVAGDQGGDKGKRLLQGLVLGVIGSIFKIPVAGIGIAFIANMLSMTALGVGLVIRGFLPKITGFDLGATNIPQGVMIGAGFVALAQVVLSVFFKKSTKIGDKKEVDAAPAMPRTVSDDSAKFTLGGSIVLHIVGAIITALVTGVISQMSIGNLILWVLFASISATVAMLLVGIAAMESGWFPAMAITMIFLTFGIFIGIPALPLAVVTGYIGSVGPCFADMGYDLKTGWMIRGSGKNPEHEVYGRKQQVRFEFVGIVCGTIMVMVFGVLFMQQGIIPPMAKVFATTIQAGADSSVIPTLLLAAIPGALLQLLFGSRSVGILFATGLLLNNPVYGVGLIIALIIRKIFGNEFMEIRDAGLIAGDGLYGFFSSVVKAFL